MENGELRPNGCAKTVTCWPAARLGTNPDSWMRPPNTTSRVVVVNVTPWVENVWSAPADVPASLDATSRK